VGDRRRKSLGRDAFDDSPESRESETVRKLIRGRSPLAPDAREVEVTVRLTPSSLKHLDQVRRRLEARGRRVSRDDLIRIAITLLRDEDIK
jgi:hypothetical protein